MNDLGSELDDQTAQGPELRGRPGAPGKKKLRDAEISDPCCVNIIARAVPNDDRRTAALSIERRKQVVELPLQSSRTELADDIEKPAVSIGTRRAGSDPTRVEHL
jgi:hypothetical protein